ncbi:glycosidase [Paenibacillus sp. SORGH_AS306]|nr:hypothetical protein [Paenibacillus sp. SORGH_AS_0306]MDQ1235263.1 glycosidase [Paenibacillus sp. SORGH_AS_0306]
MENKKARESVIYQIYPPSFMDSNNDGWGDLNGIASADSLSSSTRH